MTDEHATPENTETPETFEEWLQFHIDFAAEQLSIHYTDNNVPYEQWSLEWQTLCRIQAAHRRYSQESNEFEIDPILPGQEQ